MNWDFIGRLSGSDYVISVEEGPHLWNHVSKVCRVLMRRNYIDEKSEVKTSIFGQISPNLDSPNFWHVIWQLGTILYFLKVGVNLLKPHNHWPAGVGGSWNPKNHWISPNLRTSAKTISNKILMPELILRYLQNENRVYKYYLSFCWNLNKISYKGTRTLVSHTENISDLKWKLSQV